jgi:hypothetical protein
MVKQETSVFARYVTEVSESGRFCGTSAVAVAGVRGQIGRSSPIIRVFYWGLPS